MTQIQTLKFKYTVLIKRYARAHAVDQPAIMAQIQRNLTKQERLAHA